MGPLHNGRWRDGGLRRPFTYCEAAGGFTYGFAGGLVQGQYFADTLHSGVVSGMWGAAIGAPVGAAFGALSGWRQAHAAARNASRPSANQAAIRRRVEANIAKSQAARSRSNVVVLFAKEAQLRAGYAPDAWSMTKLTEGSIVFGGIPGESGFFTDASTVAGSGSSRTTLFQSLQVKANPDLGHRPAVAMCRIMHDIRVPAGNALNNPAFGSGGERQFFINNHQQCVKYPNYIPL